MLEHKNNNNRARGRGAHREMVSDYINNTLAEPLKRLEAHTAEYWRLSVKVNRTAEEEARRRWLAGAMDADSGILRVHAKQAARLRDSFNRGSVEQQYFPV